MTKLIKAKSYRLTTKNIQI